MHSLTLSMEHEKITISSSSKSFFLTINKLFVSRKNYLWKITNWSKILKCDHLTPTLKYKEIFKICISL